MHANVLARMHVLILRQGKTSSVPPQHILRNICKLTNTQQQQPRQQQH
jgi:hypothetical protein